MTTDLRPQTRRRAGGRSPRPFRAPVRLIALGAIGAVALGLGGVAIAPANAADPVAVNQSWLDYYFNNKAIGGDTPGDNPAFESSNGYHRTNLVAGSTELGPNGVKFGTDSNHPTDTTLKYRMGGDVLGQHPDNVEARGQVVNTAVALGSQATQAATKFAFILAGHNASGGITGNFVLRYSDNSTAALPVPVSDWCASPVAGNVVVAVPKARYGSSTQCTIFATNVFNVPEGKKLDAITFPENTNIHVFAIASDANTSAAGFAVDGQPTLAANPKVGDTVSPAIQWQGTSPASLTNTWYVDGAAVTGVNTSAQVIPASWGGKTLQYGMVAHAPGYRPISAVSNTVAVQPGTINVVTSPTVSGLARVGDTLVVSDGAYSITSENPTTVSTQIAWLADGAVIAGATGATFVPTAAQVGKAISARITVDKIGYTQRVVTTSATALVLAANVSPFPPGPTGPTDPSDPTPQPALVSIRKAASASASARVGAVARANPGSYTPANATIQYQWLRGTSPIARATSATYRATPRDRNQILSVRVTASASGRQSVVQIRTIGRVAAGTIAVKKPSVLAGKKTVRKNARVKVGQKLTVRAAKATSPGARSKRTIQWYANGKKVAGKAGKRARLTLSRRLVGKRLTVTVTYKAAGYTTKAVTSVRTGKVAR